MCLGFARTLPTFTGWEDMPLVYYAVKPPLESLRFKFQWPIQTPNTSDSSYHHQLFSMYGKSDINHIMILNSASVNMNMVTVVSGFITPGTYYTSNECQSHLPSCGGLYSDSARESTREVTGRKQYRHKTWLDVLNEFAKLGKATISFLMSVRRELGSQ